MWPTWEAKDNHSKSERQANTRPTNNNASPHPPPPPRKASLCVHCDHSMPPGTGIINDLPADNDEPYRETATYRDSSTRGLEGFR